MEGEALAIGAAGHQRQQNGRRTDQGFHPDAALVRQRHQLRAGVGHRRATGFGNQTQIMAVQQRLQQGGDVGRGGVLVQRAHGEFTNGRVDAQRFQVFARGFPLPPRNGSGAALWRARLRRPGDGLVAQRGGDQEQGAAHCKISTPSLASIVISLNSGTPIKALGSSDSTRSSSAPPRPSLLALPAVQRVRLAFQIVADLRVAQRAQGDAGDAHRFLQPTLGAVVQGQRRMKHHGAAAHPLQHLDAVVERSWLAYLLPVKQCHLI